MLKNKSKQFTQSNARLWRLSCLLVPMVFQDGLRGVRILHPPHYQRSAVPKRRIESCPPAPDGDKRLGNLGIWDDSEPAIIVWETQQTTAQGGTLGTRGITM